MTAYEAGRRFEYKTINDLEARGFVIVRAAGSAGSGKVDIIAVSPVAHLWIQCKRNGVIIPGEWNRLRECALWAGAVPILASNGVHGRGVVYEHLIADKVPYSRTRPATLYNFPQLDNI